MRTAFFQALLDLAKANDRIYLLTGDLGYSVVEPFMEQFPNRFVNVGVAEQNLTGIATGLALSGKIVFTYSIANFPTLRCLEQVRNDVCYHNANVKIVAVGGGLAYGALGASHHGTEDLAILRTLPNMTVLAPADPVEAALATRAVVAWDGPCYLRLGKAGEQRIHTEVPRFRIGEPIELRPGRDVVLLSTGTITRNAVQATEQLQQAGISAGLYSVHTLKPLAAAWLAEIARETRVMVTIEEHTTIGGLGGAVAEVLATLAEPRARLVRIGLPDSFQKHAGSQEFLTSQQLSVEALVRQVREAVHGI